MRKERKRGEKNGKREIWEIKREKFEHGKRVKRENWEKSSKNANRF